MVTCAYATLKAQAYWWKVFHAYRRWCKKSQDSYITVFHHNISYPKNVTSTGETCIYGQYFMLLLHPRAVYISFQLHPTFNKCAYLQYLSLSAPPPPPSPPPSILPVVSRSKLICCCCSCGDMTKTELYWQLSCWFCWIMFITSTFVDTHWKGRKSSQSLASQAKLYIYVFYLQKLPERLQLKEGHCSMWIFALLLASWQWLPLWGSNLSMMDNRTQMV